jgi:hypothetical protein
MTNTHLLLCLSGEYVFGWPPFSYLLIRSRAKNILREKTSLISCETEYFWKTLRFNSDKWNCARLFYVYVDLSLLCLAICQCDNALLDMESYGTIQYPHNVIYVWTFILGQRPCGYKHRLGYQWYQLQMYMLII